MIAKLLLFTVGLLYVEAQIQNTCELIEWTGGHFDWPNEATKSIYRSSGRYIPRNVIATRAQIYRDEVFVALPRYRPGVPATLARVNLRAQRGCEAVLEPYPCWAAQEEGDSTALQSVVDIYLDENQILWVLDTGVVNSLDCPIRKAAPKVVGINILTQKKVKTVDLCGLVVPASRLQYVVTEYAPDGRPFVYVSDAATRSILVFDVAGNKGYRVVLPNAVAGSRRDVLYIALIRKPLSNFLLITYLSGSRFFQIKTDFLRAGCAAGKIQDIGAKGSKLVVLGTDNGSALFFRYEGSPEVYRWEVGTILKSSQVVYKSPENYLTTQAFPDVSRKRIRVLESNFQDFLKNTVGCGASQRVAIMISNLPQPHATC